MNICEYTENLDTLMTNKDKYKRNITKLSGDKQKQHLSYTVTLPSMAIYRFFVNKKRIS